MAKLNPDTPITITLEAYSDDCKEKIGKVNTIVLFKELAADANPDGPSFYDFLVGQFVNHFDLWETKPE